MCATPYLEPFARAVWHAHETDDEYKDERIARQGGRWGDTCLHQAFSLWGTLSTAHELAGLFGYTISFRARVLGFAFPFALWAAQSQTKQKPDGLANRVVYSLHRNIGNACYATSIASTIALIRFGGRLDKLQGVTSLGLILLGSQEKRFPPKFRYGTRLGLQVGAIGAASIYGDSYESLMALASGANLLYNFVGEGKPPLLVKPRVTLSEEGLGDYEAGKLEVDRGHVACYQPEQVPPLKRDLSIGTFQTLFDGIQWGKEDHQTQLLIQSINDTDWENGPQQKRGTDAYLSWAAEGMAKFVKTLEGRGDSDSNGDVKDWDTLILKAKHIADKLIALHSELHSEADKEALAGHLLKISTEIGNYCISDYPEKIGKLYAELCERPVTDEGKLAKLLAEERETIFHNLVYERYRKPSWWFKPIIPFLDRTDGHVQNILGWVFGRMFGLPNKAIVREDAHAGAHLMEKVLCWLIWSDLPQQFWKKYNTEVLIRVADKAISADGKKGVAIDRDEFNSWIQKRQGGEFCFQLSQAKPAVVGAFLVEHGFLVPNQTHP